ncbi:MAG: hypothetical protein JJ953_09460 [Gracilimonas sp.]|uniref:hypothetical protein n=1 Tax=Gracilimonas sp. TaxID=1974203 RepID=UPI001B0FCC98|nr:hypothetical protein [Gracilimonas sp.]MBO6586318.1 hypothetical protein [Gracilimonas sp.]MBO6614975.1 hypothetical protein [Gracilimonas sp.]
MDEQIHFRRIRPRIRVKTALSSEDIHRRIRAQLNSDNAACEGQTTKGFATIYPPHKDQHFWSPQLTITVEENEDGNLVRGLYGPKPSVWTMFVFFYSVIGFATMIILMAGLSLWSLGNPATILWLFPVLLLLFLSLYLVAYFGQKLGHKQMGNIHRFIEECLEQKIEAD